MSNSVEWTNKSQNYDYSTDTRAIAWRFRKEIEPKIESFLDDVKQKTMVIGSYNLTNEPWRMNVILEWRKFGIKVCEKVVNDLTEITLKKQNISRTHVN